MADISKINFIAMREPTDSLKEYWRKLYVRNQSKWIRRSKLTKEHLDQEFLWDGIEYSLEGAVDSLHMLVKRIGDNKYFRVHSDLVDKAFNIN
jgi:hypothetical protein